MKILVTGARGFLGKNLVAELRNIRDGKTESSLPKDLTIYEYGSSNDLETLDRYCKDADFVFNLAGVNRPRDPAEYTSGNRDFAATLIKALERHNNLCPVMYASSCQATIDNPYGRSKAAAEELLFRHASETGAKVLIYRFSNLFGKWGKPNYNSVVATFCHNIARDLPIRLDNPETEMPLTYVDDAVRELISAASGRETRGYDPRFCVVPCLYHVKLGTLANTIRSFKSCRKDRTLANLADSFVRKLRATYLSYLPTDQFSYPLEMHTDPRGSFTEFIRTPDRGQFSVNVAKPGVIKGEHWHHSKNEKFLVVSGKGVIRFRKPNEEAIYEYFVSGDKLEVVDIPPGYAHHIENLGDRDLVTLMWSDVCFDPKAPDTYRENVGTPEKDARDSRGKNAK